MFEVEEIPTVVVLRPDCTVLSPNAVTEICSLGTNCYQNWQEAAELIDRNFLMNEEYDESKRRSFTDAIRRQKYKVEDKKKEEKKKKEQDGGGDDDDGGGPWGWEWFSKTLIFLFLLEKLGICGLPLHLSCWLVDGQRSFCAPLALVFRY